jgi:hypothetical protein
MVATIDGVAFSQRAIDRWVDECEAIVRKLLAQGVALEDMPAEQGRENTDGSFTVFVVAPNGVELGIVIPPGDWTRLSLCSN